MTGPRLHPDLSERKVRVPRRGSTQWQRNAARNLARASTSPPYGSVSHPWQAIPGAHARLTWLSPSRITEPGRDLRLDPEPTLG